MNNIKKHWKEILIGLLIVFSLNRCTVACNRDTKINKQQVELTKKDSVIQVQNDSLKVLNVKWNATESNRNDLVGVALDTKQELAKQVNQLKIDNDLLNQKVSQLTSENNQLKKENKHLKEQLKNE